MDLNQIIFLLQIVFTAAIAENMALYYFLGTCPLISVSSDLRTSFQMGLTVSFVMLIATAFNFVIYHYLLVPLQIEYLQLLFFVLVIAAVTQFLEQFLDRFFPEIYASFGIFLPLIAVNCAILGVCIFVVLREYDFVSSVAYSLGSGLGWLLVICLMASLRRRVDETRISIYLGKTGITMLIASVMAMAFYGLSTVIKGLG
ncbi:MAG: NADH:ubiquinone reductase (Na(+)-transporting) subunit E [Candidatus Riflebacteria bacterium]|nr:NADH:ubiquinone reductase (Na(+)-transporting) subunit E [Candidatus Riflebacteria bacterium]